eukprot:GEMP01080398.1.p1 GENE.GEMP01080398.1~~GEMP01080398.1.p1  ORF type:complete len:127 (+),score=27.32 GEMP01080398.1:279-659(+)
MVGSEAARELADLSEKVAELEKARAWKYRVILLGVVLIFLFWVGSTGLLMNQRDLRYDTKMVSTAAVKNDLAPPSALQYADGSLMQMLSFIADNFVNFLTAVRAQILELGVGSVWAICIIVYLLMP